MRMKNHFSKMGKALLNVALLSTVGFTSCADDKFHLKDYEETTPAFLGQSIYHELQARGVYSNVLRLIDDLEYADVLSKTGSKTLFVANDSAYAEFFKNNPWGVTCYDDLSKNQKRVLLNNSMLNNAYVLEMLANTEGGGKNLCLRQITSATVSDSVACWHPDSLPTTLSPSDTDWFKSLRERGDSVYMALDATDPLMVHFIEGQLKLKNVEFADVEKIMGRPWHLEGAASFGFINDSRIIEGDVVCLNGYIHVLDKVLVAPGNMAEMIRQNPKTSLFSAMLDRFAAPYYNDNLTKQYKALNVINADSIYEKRYISNRSQGGSGISKDPNGEGFNPNQFFLPFDPGWNQYAVSSSTPKEYDMAAMFVPNNDAMIEYFVRGGGKEMIERYGIADNTAENLELNLYQIPLSLIHPLIENLMKDSFNESVPSKYATIVNDAQDYMFTTSYATVDEFKSGIVECMVANNGVVYVMGALNAPAEYASVMAPVSLLSNLSVVRTIVKADDNYIEGQKFNEAPLKQYFSTYLKAMQSDFTFFVPTDAGLASYGIVDPVGYARNYYGRDNTVQGLDKDNPRYYWRFTYDDSKETKFPIAAKFYVYDVNTGQNPTTDKPHKINDKNGSDGADESSTLGNHKKALLMEMINQHIIVHDDPIGVSDGRTYYMARNGAPVRLTNKNIAADTINKGMCVEGGFQVMLNDPAEGNAANDHTAVVLNSYDKTRAKNEYGNGMTYIIDRPIQATMRSVYNHLTFSEDPTTADVYESPYTEFVNLAVASNVKDDLLEACGYYTKIEGGKEVKMTDTEKQRERMKLLVFVDRSQGSGLNMAMNDQLVRFFNNYHYTVYLPTNEHVQAAFDKGLKSWTQIEDWVKARSNDYKSPLSEDDKAKARTMITVLVNFVKYHFQDQSVFVDNVSAEQQYQTACIDNETNSYLPLTVTQSPSALSVLDRSGNRVNVTASEENRNLLARDICYDKAYGSATTIKNSSYAVLHQLEGYLNYHTSDDYASLYKDGVAMPVGRFDIWNYATPTQLNSYVAKYRLR